MSTTVETSEEWANELNDLGFGGVTEDVSLLHKEDLGNVADDDDELEAPNKKRKAAQEDVEPKKAPKTESKKTASAAEAALSK